MIQLKICGSPYVLPDRWDVLTPEQIYDVLPVTFGTEPTAVNRLTVIRKVIRKVIHKADKSKTDIIGSVTGSGIKMKTLRKLSDQERFDLLELVRWCWDTPLSFCPITHFDFEGTRFYLPEPNFGNACAVEYAMADVFFRSFTQNHKVDALNKLVATLCRPEKRNLDTTDPEWDGDRREKYHAKFAENRAQDFARLPLYEKILVLQYFTGSVRAITNQYDIWEKQPASDSSVQTDQATGPIRPSWLMLLMDIAEQGIFGDWDKTCYTPLHTVLFYLANKKAKQESE